MANYVNITLDTIGPAGVSVLINDDADKVTSTSATLTISCEDADLSGYQMKIWGTADAPTESDALWETFQEEKDITLSSGDGLKTVFVKVRDDVWNESATVSDTVTLYEKLPSIIGLSVNKSKLSLVEGQRVTVGSFGIDEDIDAVRVMIVQNVNDTYDAPTNVSIPVTNGSKIYNENDETVSGAFLEAESTLNNVQLVYFDICAADISAVAPGDGVKIVKVFVRSAANGNWSV